MNYTYLEKVMHRAGLPAEAVESLLCTAHSLDEKVKNIIAEGLQAYHADTFFDFKEYLTQIADASAEGEKEAALLIFSFALTEHTEQLYRERGWSKEMFENMLLDLKTKNEECYRYYGRWGTFVSEWFNRWFSLQRVALERLQFEVRKFGSNYKSLTPESLVINVHIPAIGPLDRAACLRDYDRAAALFADEIDGPIAFMCHSWMLNPDHPDFLPPTSRILAFQSDYEIIGFNEDKEGSFLWRFFGVPYDGNPEHLTERNSLERAYKQRMREGKPVGGGKGVFFYKAN